MTRSATPPPAQPAAALSRVGAGDTVYRRGDAAGSLYVIAEGEVEILGGEPGREWRVALLGPGDFFGEGDLLTGSPRRETAHARVACELLALDAAQLEAVVREEPGIALAMLRRLAVRLTAAAAAPDSEPPAAAAGRARERAHGAAALCHPETGWEVPLGPAVARIGRADPTRPPLPDIDLAGLPGGPSVSRRHASIRREEDGYLLTAEPGAVNGTFLNGRPLADGQPAALADGDEVRFGAVTLRFRRPDRDRQPRRTP